MDSKNLEGKKLLSANVFGLPDKSDLLRNDRRGACGFVERLAIDDSPSGKTRNPSHLSVSVRALGSTPRTSANGLWIWA